MKPSWAIPALCALALAVSVRAARADTVVLKSGEQVVGKVTEGEADLKVETADGMLTISLDRVERIVREDGTADTTPAPAPSLAPQEGGIQVRAYTEPGRTRDLGEFLAKIRAASGAADSPGAAQGAPDEKMRALLAKNVKLELAEGTLAEVARKAGEAAGVEIVVDPAADKGAKALAPGVYEGALSELLSRAARACDGRCRALQDRIIIGVPAPAKRQKEYPEAPLGDQVIVIQRLTPVSAEAVALLQRRISVDFDNVPLYDVIEELRETTGANFSFRPADLEAEAQPVTLKVNDVPLAQVLDLVFEARQVGWAVRNDVIRIRPKGESQ